MTGSFPTDWLDPQSRGAATDLDLAVLLVNTVDNLVSEPDRLHDLVWFRAALAQVGHTTLARQLRSADLSDLRRLREDLRAVFASTDERTVVTRLNSMLERAHAVPLLDASGAELRMSVGVGRRGVAALEARLPAALAAYVVEHGVDRLGTCAAEPCSCAFVDHTRGGTRRYCCTYCNDRAAARAYRRRQRTRRLT
jgi:predicted RNA-binding Zn ribbon-like protein